MPFDRRKLQTLALSMTSGIVLAAAAASPAYADGGRGGDGYNLYGSPAGGGAGGSEGAAGQNGSRYDFLGNDAGGGGGGGGAGGGLGGAGGDGGCCGGTAGGAGGNGGAHGGSLSGSQSLNGLLIGLDGSAGNQGGDLAAGQAAGGGGGGGGAGGYGLVMTGASNVTGHSGAGATGGNGGNGGLGGNGNGFNSRGGSGGSGGDGGIAVHFTGANAVLNNSRTLRGGNGGTGGDGGRSDLGNLDNPDSHSGSGGDGGKGGAGVQFDAAGATVINSGLIHGGNGGHGGATGAGSAPASRAGLGGAGGAGIVGSGMSIINTGSIVGGLGADGTRADAITFTGGTNSLRLSGGGTLTGNIGITAAGSSVSFDQATDFTLSNDITGLGGIIQAGVGKLTLTGTNTYTGGTEILSGSTLQLGAGGNTGSIMGDVANSGTLIFARSDAVTFDGAISGTGEVIKNGGNFLTLTGANTYSGQTTVLNGVLRQGAAGAFSANSHYQLWAATTLDLNHFDGAVGSLSGSGRVELSGQTLTIGANDGTSNFGGTIANGDLVKIGTGELGLGGRYTNLGTVYVDGGTVGVNSNELASTRFIVNAGGTLSGYGMAGTTEINGGTLSPGSYISTLTIQGNLSMTAASTYMVELEPSQSDRVDVTGKATLGGATVNAIFLPPVQNKRAAPGAGADVYVAKQYTILNAAGGLDGKFGSLVNTDLPSGFASTLSYDANNVYLDLKLAFSPPGGLPGNQQAVGDALTGFFNRTGGIPLAFGTLDAKGLSQISGETTTGSQQTSVDAANMFMGMMIDPFAVGRGEVAVGVNSYADEAMAYAPKRAGTDAFASMHRKAPVLAPAFQERWNMWASGFGGSQTTDGNVAAGSNNSKSSIYGMGVGADYWFSPFTVAGFSMAGGGTNFSVNGGGTGRSDLFQVGGFIRHNVGATYISAAAAYGWQDITTDRTVTVAGVDQLRANFNASSYSGRFEVGHRFATPWIGGLGLTPYAAFQVTAFDLPSYAESVVAGSNTFALTYAGKTSLSPRSELGLRTDKSFALNDAILTLRGRAAWAHDTNRDRSASATFQSLPGASFIVNGAALAKHTALTSASAELKWMNGWSVAGTFEGEFSDVTTSYAGKGVVRYAW